MMTWRGRGGKGGRTCGFASDGYHQFGVNGLAECDELGFDLWGEGIDFEEEFLFSGLFGSFESEDHQFRLSDSSLHQLHVLKVSLLFEFFEFCYCPIDRECKR